METVESHVGKMEAELRQWGTRLDNLLAMADVVGTAARIDHRQRLEDLKEKYDAAEAKLAELKSAGDPPAGRRSRLERPREGVHEAGELVARETPGGCRWPICPFAETAARATGLHRWGSLWACAGIRFAWLPRS